MSATAGKTSRKHRYVDPAEFTPQFAWRRLEKSGKGALGVYCEDVPLAQAAEKFGTPVYVYSKTAITAAFRELSAGLRGLPHTICFAMKSNRNLTLLRHLAKLGSGFDIVSGGELKQLEHLRVRGERIVFSGVGKSREEIREALRYGGRKRNGKRGILLFNVESEAELEVLLEEAEAEKRRGASAPRVSIRVNPDVQAGGHPHISTGHHQHKFGLDWAAAHALYVKHRESKTIRWKGISAHIGSQIVSRGPFERAFGRLASYVKQLRGDGFSLRYLDLGGGLGVRYTEERPMSRAEYARMVARMALPLGAHLLLEPGRSIIASAGVLLTRVLYMKEIRGKRFVIVDAAMNDLMRPTLYGATHPITRVLRMRGKDYGWARAEIAGPVCETGDCFLHDWPIGEVEPGDVLAIWTAGAYGMSLASNYNARRRPAEVLVEGRHARLIRRRETDADLMRGDVLA
jgi:diaminopimelate decarboxylase